LKVALLLGLGAIGCGPELEKQSEVDSLRVLAVQKSQPIARPGQRVDLKMLWHDGTEPDKSKAPRNVDITWLGWCVNPVGGLYYNCFSQLTEALATDLLTQVEQPPQPDACTWPAGGKGDTLSVCIPKTNTQLGRSPTDASGYDLIQPLDPKQPPYALFYVFFAACAGKLAFGEGGGTEAAAFQIPLRCVDSQGEALGPDDFVVGYSTLSVYSEDRQDIKNRNTGVTGIEFGGRTYPKPESNGNGVTCIGPDCIGEQRLCLEKTGAKCEANADCCSGSCKDGACAQPSAGVLPVVDRCPKDGDCKEIEFKPIIDQELIDDDPISSLGGKTFEEQQWVTYSVAGGEVANELRLINDPTVGFNSQYETKYKPPQEPGWSYVWAVVRDNRGGVNWVRQRIWVK
jgi:hypothetical protein